MIWVRASRAPQTNEVWARGGEEERRRGGEEERRRGGEEAILGVVEGKHSPQKASVPNSQQNPVVVVIDVHRKRECKVKMIGEGGGTI